MGQEWVRQSVSHFQASCASATGRRVLRIAVGWTVRDAVPGLQISEAQLLVARRVVPPAAPPAQEEQHGSCEGRQQQAADNTACATVSTCSAPKVVQFFIEFVHINNVMSRLEESSSLHQAISSGSDPVLLGPR